MWKIPEASCKYTLYWRKAKMDVSTGSVMAASVYIPQWGQVSHSHERESCLTFLDPTVYVSLKFKNGKHSLACVSWGSAELASLICAWCIWFSVRAYLWWFTLVFMPLTNCYSCPRCFEKAMFITENGYNCLIYTSAKYHGKHLNNGTAEQTTW